MTTMTTMRYSEMVAAPNHGLTRVVELTWDRRDRGGKWLVVERGHRVDRDGDRWTSTGRLVATAPTLAGAKQCAGKASARLRRCGITPTIDIVPRDEVEIVLSAAPYGCTSGEVGA